MVQQVSNNIPTPYYNPRNIYLPQPDLSWSINDRNKRDGLQAQLIFDLSQYAKTHKIDNETPALQKLMGTRKTDSGEQFIICLSLVQSLCVPIQSPRIRAATTMILIDFFNKLQERNEFPLKTISMFVTISGIMLEEALDGDNPTKRLSEIDDFPLLICHLFNYRGPEIKNMSGERAVLLLEKEIHRRGFDKFKIDREKFGDQIIGLLEKKLVDFKNDKKYEEYIDLRILGITIHDTTALEEKSDQE